MHKIFNVFTFCLSICSYSTAASTPQPLEILSSSERINFANEVCLTLQTQPCHITKYKDENLLLSHFLFNTQSIAILDKKIDRVFLVPYRKLNQLSPQCYTNNHTSQSFFIYVNQKNPIKELKINDFYKVFTKKNAGGDYIIWNSISPNSILSALKINKLISTRNHDLSYIHSIFGEKEYADDVTLIEKDQISEILQQDTTAIALVNYPIKNRNVRQIKIINPTNQENTALSSGDYIYIHPSSPMNQKLANKLRPCDEV